MLLCNSTVHCPLYVLHLNSCRDNLMVSPWSIGQGTHRVTYLSLAQSCWPLMSNLSVGHVADSSGETVSLEITSHVQYIVIPTSTPRMMMPVLGCQEGLASVRRENLPTQDRLHLAGGLAQCAPHWCLPLCGAPPASSPALGWAGTAAGLQMLCSESGS